MEEPDVVDIKGGAGEVEGGEESVAGVAQLKHDADEAGAEGLGPGGEFAVALVAGDEVHVDEADAHDEVDDIAIERGHGQVVGDDEGTLCGEAHQQPHHEEGAEVRAEEVDAHLLVPIPEERDDDEGVQHHPRPVGDDEYEAHIGQEEEAGGDLAGIVEDDSDGGDVEHLAAAYPYQCIDIGDDPEHGAGGEEHDLRDGVVLGVEPRLRRLEVLEDIDGVGGDLYEWYHGVWVNLTSLPSASLLS